MPLAWMHAATATSPSSPQPALWSSRSSSAPIRPKACQPEGLPEPLPGEAEAAGLEARAAAALAGDPRVDPTRVGALGFGIGARAVVLAPPREDGRDTFAARILLYPGCGSLGDLVRAPEHAAAT